MSDQAALPNLNANWVNAKGEFGLDCLIDKGSNRMDDRCLDDPFCLDCCAKDLL